jgi:hypothetical protein
MWTGALLAINTTSTGLRATKSDTQHKKMAESHSGYCLCFVHLAPHSHERHRMICHEDDTQEMISFLNKHSNQIHYQPLAVSWFVSFHSNFSRLLKCTIATSLIFTVKVRYFWNISCQPSISSAPFTRVHHSHTFRKSTRHEPVGGREIKYAITPGYRYNVIYFIVSATSCNSRELLPGFT